MIKICLKNIFVFTITCIITFILLEVTLRYTSISLPSYATDSPQYGRTLKPKSLIFDAKAEGFCVDQVNRYGYMGPAYPYEKEENTIRIGLIGDSFVEALQVFERHRFRSLLEKKIQDDFESKKIEVLNFGLGGVDFRDMYFIATKRLSQYKPDLVLIFIKNEDLYRENHIAGPKMILKENSLEVDYGFLESKESNIRNKFKFVRNFSIGNLAKEAFEYYYYGKTMDILFGKLNPVKNTEESYHNVKTNEDKFNKINNKIFEDLAKPLNDVKTILVIANEINPAYLEMINRYNLDTINLNQFLSDLKMKGKRLEYWKASNREGHWNHQAHQYISSYLYTQLLPYLK